MEILTGPWSCSTTAMPTFVLGDPSPIVPCVCVFVACMCCGIVGTCGLGVVAVAVTALGVADVGAGLRAIGWLCVDGTRVMRVVGSSSSATACVGVVAYASNGAAC